MIPISAFVATLTILAALIATLSVSIANLRSRWAHRVPYRWTSLLYSLRSIIVLAAFVTIGIAMPHPAILFALFVVTAVMMTAIHSNSQEESAALNDLIRLVAARRGAVPEAIESFASGARGRVGLRAAHFAYRLRCGEPVEAAARRSRAPVMADAILALQSTSSGGVSADNFTSKPGIHHLLPMTATAELPWRTGPAWLRVHTRPQLTYLAYLIAFSMLVGWFIRTWILPTAEQIAGEFGFEFAAHQSWLETLYVVSSHASTVVIWACVVWLALIMLVSLFPAKWLIRCTPWYGERLRTRNRASGLRTMAHGIERGESIERVLLSAQANSRSRWIRWRSATASKRIAQGESIAGGLRRSQWLSATEAAWIDAAERNGHLATAMYRLADDIERRYELRWQVRLAWLVPVTVSATGLFVFAHSYYLFAFVMGFINALS